MNVRSDNRNHSESGAVLIFMVLVLVPLLACLALAVDGFIVMSGKMQQERIVESAALSGLEHYVTTQNSELAVQRAEQTVLANGMVTIRGKGIVDKGKLVSGEQGKLDLGEYDPSTRRFTPRIGGPFNALRVELRNNDSRSVVALLSGVVGFKNFALKSSAIAYYNKPEGCSHTNPYSLVREVRTN